MVPRSGLRLHVALAEPSLLSNFRAILYLGIFKGSVLLLTKYVIFKKGNCTVGSSTRQNRFCRARTTSPSCCSQMGAPVSCRATCCPAAGLQRTPRMEGSRLRPRPYIPRPGVPESRVWREPTTGTGPQGSGMPSSPEMRAEKSECQPPLVSSVFTADRPPFLAMTLPAMRSRSPGSGLWPHPLPRSCPGEAVRNSHRHRSSDLPYAVQFPLFSPLV